MTKVQKKQRKHNKITKMKMIQKRKNRHNKIHKQFQRERRKLLYRRRLTINDTNKMNLNGKFLVNGDKNKNSVHVKGLITLKKRCLLNDEVINLNFYVKLILICAASINIKEHRLEYYDSIMYEGRKNEVLSRLKNYVEEEFKDKKKVKNYDVSEWVYYTVENLPQQTNKYDCVVFAMTFAEHISRGASVLFVPPKHMKYFRLKMMWEIINSKLLPIDQ